MVRHTTLRLIFTISVLWVLALGCQQGGSNPAAPSLADPAFGSDTPVAFGVVAGPDMVEAAFARYQLVIENDLARLEPGRMATAPVGQHFNVDITDALTKTFCKTCLKVTSIRRAGNDVQVNLQLRHPFPLADEGAEPTAMNRRDLFISNVKGILLFESSDSYFDGAIRAEAGVLSNADGLTNLLDIPGTLNANAFPYKVFGAQGDNLGIGTFDGTLGWGLVFDNPSGYNVIGNDQTADASYNLRLAPGESVAVELVLTAAFATSAAIKENRILPTYFMPAGAPPEPWKADVLQGAPLIAGNPVSTTNLTFRALDWQQDPSLSIDPNFPDVLNRRGLVADSRIAGVTFSLPTITGEGITTVDISGAVGTGFAADPWKVTASLTNITGAGAGSYLGLAKFLDERDPNGGTPPLGPVTFIADDLVTPYAGPGEFATYAAFSVVVSETGCLPFDQFHSDEADLYIDTEPLYQLVGTEQELLDTLALLDSTPPVLPPIDWDLQSVIVACAGFFATGKDLHLVDINSVCPNAANGNTISLDRGEPLGPCPEGPISTAPYVLGLISTKNPEHSFSEQFYDTCGPVDCTNLTPVIVDGGNAVDNGYMGGVVEGIALDDTEFMALAGPLYGNSPLPLIDFNTRVAIVLSAGFFADDLGARYLQLTNVCRVVPSGEMSIQWEHGEYIECAVNDGTATAPFGVWTVAKPASGAVFSETIIDVCLPPEPCANGIPFQVIAQADVRDITSSAPLTQRFTNPSDFGTAWGEFFLEIPTPKVLFGDVDVYMIAMDQTMEVGRHRITVDNVCFDPDELLITVQYSHYLPMAPGCPGPPDLPSRLVTVITAERTSPVGSPTVMFEENLEDFCGSLPCALPVTEPMAKGNAAGQWTTETGMDMVIDTQVVLDELWVLAHPAGPPPPRIDFRDVSVVFTTSGFHDSGVDQHDIKLELACSKGNQSGVQITEFVPQTCPPPVPTATTPFEFVMIPKPGPNPPQGWFAFQRTEVDTCEPTPECTPQPATELDFGDYPDNTDAEPYEAWVGNQISFVTAWNTFFTNPGSRPPMPTIDFTVMDALLFSSGATLDGRGQRTLNGLTICVDAGLGAIAVDAIQGEPLDCRIEVGPAHPWSLLLVPKGAATWAQEINFLVIDTCEPDGDCFEFEGLSSGLVSQWTDPASNYLYIADEDFDTRLEAYRDAWALLGPGEPPGIKTLTEEDAVVVLMYGFRTSGLAQHNIVMDFFCQDTNGRLLATLTRFTPLGGCNVNQALNSPYAIYKVPIISATCQFDDSTVIDSCE